MEIWTGCVSHYERGHGAPAYTFPHREVLYLFFNIVLPVAQISVWFLLLKNHSEADTLSTKNKNGFLWISKMLLFRQWKHICNYHNLSWTVTRISSCGWSYVSGMYTRTKKYLCRGWSTTSETIRHNSYANQYISHCYCCQKCEKHSNLCQWGQGWQRAMGIKSWTAVVVKHPRG